MARTAELAHVCGVIGCPHLQPCPTHGRDNRKRSPWRHSRKQDWFRRGLLLRSPARCERCGGHFPDSELFAHHDRSGWDLEHGRLLCRNCHKAVDPHAR